MCCDNQAYDGLNRAKCWGFTSLVFGCFCILGGLNVASSGGNTGVIIGSLGEGIGGILMVIAASQVGCCPQLHREGVSMQEMNGAQGKVNSAKGFGMVAIGLYLVSLIGWIMAVMAVLQCANKEGCLQGAERSLTFRAGSNGDIPGQCSVSACEERYGRIGEWGGSWSENHDCVSSKRDSRCSGNMTAYLSSASAFSNLDERVNECYPLLCCLPAGGEPPANFVPLAEHNCPFADGTQDPAYGCQYREFCSLILPIFYGAIGYMVLVLIFGALYVFSLSILKGKLDAAARGVEPGIPLQPVPVAQAVATAQPIPMAQAQPASGPSNLPVALAVAKVDGPEI